MKRLGLISVLGLALIAAPGAALAAGVDFTVVVVDSTAVDFTVVVVADSTAVDFTVAGLTAAGHYVAPAPVHAAPGWGYRGVAPAYGRGVAPVYRGAPAYGHGVAPGYGYRYAPVYGHVGVVRPVAPLWVPGYWGWNSGVRVWIGGSWALPALRGLGLGARALGAGTDTSGSGRAATGRRPITRYVTDDKKIRGGRSGPHGVV